MDDLVNKLIDEMVGQAKLEADKLEKQLMAEGQIYVPQVLAQGEWCNSQGEEFVFVIMLDLVQSEFGKQLGWTCLKLFTFYDEKYMIDNYLAGILGPFSKNVASDEFRTETLKYIERVTCDDGKKIKRNISDDGISAIRSFIVPEKLQMKLLRLPLDCIISIGDATFDGIDAIRAYMRNQTNSSRPYIVDRCELFPCFDAEDYANENRFYRNYFFFASKQEADKKVSKIAHLHSSINCCLANDSLPADMRPMVYYMDESASMILAY